MKYLRIGTSMYAGYEIWCMTFAYMAQDLPPHMFIKSSPNSHGFVNARDTEDLWRDHFDYFYREYDEFIFVSPTFDPVLAVPPL